MSSEHKYNHIHPLCSFIPSKNDKIYVDCSLSKAKTGIVTGLTRNFVKYKQENSKNSYMARYDKIKITNKSINSSIIYIENGDLVSFKRNNMFLFGVVIHVEAQVLVNTFNRLKMVSSLVPEKDLIFISKGYELEDDKKFYSCYVAELTPDFHILDTNYLNEDPSFYIDYQTSISEDQLDREYYYYTEEDMSYIQHAKIVSMNTEQIKRVDDSFTNESQKQKLDTESSHSSQTETQAVPLQTDSNIHLRTTENLSTTDSSIKSSTYMENSQNINSQPIKQNNTENSTVPFESNIQGLNESTIIKTENKDTSLLVLKQEENTDTSQNTEFPVSRMLIYPVPCVVFAISDEDDHRHYPNVVCMHLPGSEEALSVIPAIKLTPGAIVMLLPNELLEHTNDLLLSVNQNAVNTSNHEKRTIQDKHDANIPIPSFNQAPVNSQYSMPQINNALVNNSHSYNPASTTLQSALNTQAIKSNASSSLPNTSFASQYINATQIPHQNVLNYQSTIMNTPFSLQSKPSSRNTTKESYNNIPVYLQKESFISKSEEVVTNNTSVQT